MTEIKNITGLTQKLYNVFNTLRKNNKTMKMQNLNILYASMIILLMLSCDSKPRVIESEAAPGVTDIPTLNMSAANNTSLGEHKVVVNEVLNTDKYSYINVSENGEKFWVAISKREVGIGDTYYYKGGLLKKNFYSQEFDRTFETVYLVSDIWKNPAGSDKGMASNEAHSEMHGGQAVNLEVKNIQPAEGAITIAELYANKEKYNGKTIKVTGKCIKVNPMIMNRNWIHLKDSSTDDFDLTITTTENISTGAVVTLEGVIALDKDFGAGYRYDIIMEGAVLK